MWQINFGLYLSNVAHTLHEAHIEVINFLQVIYSHEKTLYDIK
jgi:hypothetical protein